MLTQVVEIETKILSWIARLVVSLLSDSILTFKSLACDVST